MGGDGDAAFDRRSCGSRVEGLPPASALSGKLRLNLELVDFGCNYSRDCLGAESGQTDSQGSRRDGGQKPSRSECRVADCNGRESASTSTSRSLTEDSS